MFGALTLPSVSTGFSSDSKSMLPVSIQGMADKVEMSLNVHSMEDILIDVKDSINNVGLKTLKSFTMLQETMVTGFTMLSNGLMNIGNIASKDLELEETQTNIDIENEKDEDQEESLSGGGILTDSFKGGITSVLNKLKPEGFIQSLIALGAGLALLMINFDKVAAFIGKSVEFFDEEVIPRAKTFYANIKEYYTNLFDGLFGDNGFFTVIFQGIGDIKDSIEAGDGKSLIVGVKDLLIKGTVSAISLIGTSILGILKVGAGIIDPDADLSELDKLIKFFNDLPENVTKQLSDDAKEYQKVLKEEGFAAAQVVAFRQTYDNIIGRTLNGISNTLGVVLRPFISDETYDRFLSNDYRFANIKSTLSDAFEKLGGVLERMENAISIFVNDKIESINSFLPKALQIDYRMPVKSIEGQNSYVNDEGMTVPIYKELEIGKDIGVFAEKESKPIDEVMRDQILGDGYSMINGKKFSFEKQELSNAELDELMNNKDNNMSKKTKEIKTLANEIVDDKSSIIAPIISDNKTITTNNSSSQTNIVSDQRVESMEPSSNALLAYFRQ